MLGIVEPMRRARLTHWLAALTALVCALATQVGGGRSVAAPDQPDVVIVGDSLTGGNVTYIAPTLRAADIDARVEGLSARRIAVSFDFLGRRDSGIERVRSLRAAGIEPKLWVIQLGTNDLGIVENCRCADRRVFAGELIDRMIAEIGARPMAWVTLVDRGRPDVAGAFNIALDDRAIRNPNMTTIRWHEVARDRPEWFLDDVHPNTAGIVRFAEMYVREIRALLTRLPGTTPPVSADGPRRAERIGFVFGR